MKALSPAVPKEEEKVDTRVRVTAQISVMLNSICHMRSLLVTTLEILNDLTGARSVRFPVMLDMHESFL